MVFQFKLPDIAEGVHEGEIVAWHVKPGQAVKEDQDMVEVMTDKATVMIKSPRTGTIGELLAKEGQVVKVGDVIVTIQEGEGRVDAKPVATAPPVAAPAKAVEEEKTLFDLPTDFSGGSRLKKQQGPAPAAAAKPAAPAQAATTPGASAGAPLRQQTLAAPAIRWKAREMGVDLNTVPASGPNGRITTQDWQQFLARGPMVSIPHGATHAPPSVPQFATGGSDEVVQLKGLRKAIHENMRRSKSHAAHFTYWDEADVTELIKLRQDAKELAHGMGIRLSYLPFIVKAVVAGLKKFPDINAWSDEHNRTLVRKKEYHIGIATATDRGLTVVVIRDADRKSIFEIAREIEALADKARTGKASREELTGSTFTITSLGKSGGLGATPVINHPEVAILGIHKMEPRAVVDAETRQVVVRDRMNISGSYDHRWIDGHIAAEFQQHVISLLSQPNLLLLGHL
ncbi:MAG TPA: dihydrolipoamide acetyltransferase family protein [Candidatus Thermoplasmatota archaeon]|nr:dihydrolipoamide acetyltransferase family protein [Candidatus Thermoplasmatota archaeon]